ncbi:MAG: hypothetical protein F4206_14515 [Gammaproteobacteria bacterium]|nr:hypothetical protein [Gammaproteobacteria bacterium]MYG67920.1 hypothetical protein [Gammaproteobacteria bacterium]
MTRVVKPVKPKPDTKPDTTQGSDGGDETPDNALTGGLFAAISGLWFHHSDTEEDGRATAYALWKSGGVNDTERDQLMVYLAARNRTTPQAERAEFDKLAKQDQDGG